MDENRENTEHASLGELITFAVNTINENTHPVNLHAISRILRMINHVLVPYRELIGALVVLTNLKDWNAAMRYGSVEEADAIVSNTAQIFNKLVYYPVFSYDFIANTLTATEELGINFPFRRTDAAGLSEFLIQVHAVQDNRIFAFARRRKSPKRSGKRRKSRRHSSQKLKN